MYIAVYDKNTRLIGSINVGNKVALFPSQLAFTKFMFCPLVNRTKRGTLHGGADSKANIETVLGLSGF
jgi:hypothetical protein